MTETIVPAVAPPGMSRLGDPRANDALDQILGEAWWLTTRQLANLILRAGIVGQRDSTDESPVGLWVLDRLQAAGVDARAYSWACSLTVYGPVGGRMVVLGQTTISERHTLDDLEREINDGEWPELVRGGYGDER